MFKKILINITKKINKSNSSIFLIIFLGLIIIMNKVDFTQNLAKIFSIPYLERLNRVYGFCGGESIGYLKYINEKYDLKYNPIIINYDHTPEVNWAILNTRKKKDDKNQINYIILNYPETETKDNLIKKSLRRNNLNNFEISTNFFYIKNIEIIEIIKNKKELELLTIEIKIKNTTTTDQGINKKITIKNNSPNSNFVKEILNFNYNFDPYDKIYINLLGKNNQNINSDIMAINLYLKNQINIKDFNIIDNFDNCFFAKKK